MLKMSPKLANTLSVTGVNNNKVVGSSNKNNRKLAKSDFIKPMCRVEESSFLTPNAR